MKCLEAQWGFKELFEFLALLYGKLLQNGKMRKIQTLCFAQKMHQENLT